MKPIRIFVHIACEGFCYFATLLENYNIPFELLRIDAGEIPPSQIDDISALVFMGGPMSVNDNIPVLGHCMGGQLISKAVGGKITANPVKEIG
ncbi:MAG: hypothetical protein L3J84_03605 [Gammaproteobacteria bacterium]|nr:hypothetical protein [Gammaproteobacteria bacterium]